MRSGSLLPALAFVVACGGGKSSDPEPEPAPAPDPCAAIAEKIHFEAGPDAQTRYIVDAGGTRLARVVRSSDHLHVIDPQGVPMARIRIANDTAVVSDAAGRQLANLTRAEFPDLEVAAIKVAKLPQDIASLLVCDFR